MTNVKISYLNTVYSPELTLRLCNEVSHAGKITQCEAWC